MAFRLGDYVVYGELRNRRNYSTHGVIVLRGVAPGQETVLRLDLTGNCESDLHGKSFRFTPGDGGAQDAVFRMEEYPGFQDRQIGPTGMMTAQGWVRVMPCSVEEFWRRAKLGEAPPTEWKRHLYLEWHSQNGRVLVEMAGPLVEECVREPEGEDDEGEWTPLPNLAPPPDAANPKPAHGLGFTIVRMDGDDAHIERWTPRDPALHDDDEEDVSLPEELRRELAGEASAIERAIRGDDESSDDDCTRELALMDYCLEHSEGQPVASLLGDVDHLPPPEELDDEEIETELKVILARLAGIGIALDVCEHFTPRDCYRLLKDTILPKPTAYGELAGTGWVQHFSTWEYCADCDAEHEDLTPEAGN